MFVPFRGGVHNTHIAHVDPIPLSDLNSTYAQMEALEDLADRDPNRVQIIKKAKVTKLLKDSNGVVTGVEYEFNGKSHTENGPVILATGFANLSFFAL